MILRHKKVLATLARVGGIEGARIKLGALAQALDEAKTVMIHRQIHHLQQVLGIGVRRPRHKRGPGRDGQFHRVDRTIKRPPVVSLALETERRSRGGLFLGQPINKVVHDHVGHFDVLAGGVHEVVTAD